MPILNTIMGSPILSKIGSTENGTVHGGDFLAAIKNRLYLCSAFETKKHYLCRHDEKKREAAMLFVQNLSVHGGQPVPADERGMDALIDEKYDK